MVEREDIPPDMQAHVLGVARTSVQLFQCLANVIVHYNRANKPKPLLVFDHICVEGRFCTLCSEGLRPTMYISYI
jgi:hypothetical protein